mgnify:CR=1 FL=1|tara:strand:+ start:11276 stop:12109 length:834 start_codon:yes stop_codon:yes gene_type:complete
MQKYDEIISVNPNRVSRKLVLEPLAKRLKLNPAEYKNRTTLHKAIVQAIEKPSSRCENLCDPITLESLDNLEDKYLFEWDQNNKHYGADIRSLKAMIEKKHTILPWAIDNDTGMSHSSDKESYMRKYDLKYVDGLIERIKNHELKDNYEHDYENVPDAIKFRFQIENSTSQYITHLIDFLEDCQDYKFIYFRTLIEVCNQYNGEIFESNGLNLNNAMKLNILSQIAHTVLEENTTSSPFELLVMCINTINVYFEDNSQNIIDLFFMTLNEFKNETIH